MGFKFIKLFIVISSIPYKPLNISAHVLIFSPNFIVTLLYPNSKSANLLEPLFSPFTITSEGVL